MTEAELFTETAGAYLTLIHLGEGTTDAVATILACDDRVSEELIAALVTGQSWRERLVGLVLACHRGLPRFYDDLLRGLCDIRGISTIPTAAVLSIAIADFGCAYTESMTASLDRTVFDGEVGFALDHLHHAIGKGAAPAEEKGPNFGQSFADHRAFYAGLCGV